jgi:SAM-dependent methyltransferase
MIQYSTEPSSEKSIDGVQLACFDTGSNVDQKTIAAFRAEWEKFNAFSEKDIDEVGAEYFDLLEDKGWNKDWQVLDAGCGSGRWSKYLSKRVSFVEAIDPVAAEVAASFCSSETNLRVTEAGIANIPFPNEAFDGAICLGVLHHMPDTQKGLEQIVARLKKGGWILLYLYYALDNRPWWFRFMFSLSAFFRKVISKLPGALKNFTCDLIAIFIYMPLVLLSRMVRRLGGTAKSLPLSYYADKSFYIIRNDARDRFGTPLEKRFRKEEIRAMMERAGLDQIVFSETQPYWHVIGHRK